MNFIELIYKGQNFELHSGKFYVPSYFILAHFCVNAIPLSLLFKGGKNIFKISLFDTAY